MPGEFCITVAEQILHFLAYHNYADQVLSMLELVTEHGFDFESETVLSHRMVLCSIGALVKNEVHTAEDLGKVIRQLDDHLPGSNAELLWAGYRPTAVAQVVVLMLQQEVGFDPDTNELDPAAMQRFKGGAWPATVKEVFESFQCGAEEEEEEGGGACTQQAVCDFEMVKLQETLGDVGKPDKVRLHYIFKQRAWPAFLASFEAFLRAAQDEIGGVPELLLQHQTLVPKGCMSPGGGAMPPQPPSKPAALPMPSPRPKPAPPKPAAPKPAAAKAAAAKAAAAKAAASNLAAAKVAAVKAAKVAAAPMDDVHSEDEDDDATESPDPRDYTDNGDDDRAREEEEGEEEEEVEEEPETQGASVRSLRHAARQLSQTVGAASDPLAEALAETSPATATVMARRAKPVTKPGSFVGKRETSVAVAFDSLEDSIDDEDFEERPSLPKHSTAPMAASFASFAAAPPKATAAKRSQEASSGGAKKRQRWTAEEMQLINDGVDELGHGRWAEIKTKYFMDSTRTQVDIKDKYRNMTK